MILVTDDQAALGRELRRLRDDGWVNPAWRRDEHDGLLLADPGDAARTVAVFWDDSGAPHAPEGYHALVYLDDVGDHGLHIGVVPLGEALSQAESLL